MKKILKMAYLKGITMGEASTRVTNHYNASSRRLVPLVHPDPQPSQELNLLKVQLQAMQSELKILRESTIPKINEKIGNLTEDLAKTNDRFDRFDKSLDNVIMKQEENSGSLATRFDKLDGCMTAMISIFGLKSNPSITHNPPDTIEAIGACILFRNNQHIDFASIYIPRANCETEEIEAMLDRSNPYFLGSDFNEYHPL
jgi:hypothetical protein